MVVVVVFVVVVVAVVVAVVVVVLGEEAGRGGLVVGFCFWLRVCSVALEVCWFLPCLGLVGEICVVVCAGFAVASLLCVSALRPLQVDL